MKREDFEELFLDYAEDRLDEGTKRRLEDAFRSDAELCQSYERYQEVVAYEQSTAQQRYEPNPGFAVSVMRRVERRGGFIERLSMLLAMNPRVAASLLATTAVVVLVVRLAEDTPWSAVTFDTPRQIAPSPSRQVVPQPIIPVPVTPPMSEGQVKEVLEAPSAAGVSGGRRSTTIDVTGYGVDRAKVGSSIDIYLDQKIGDQFARTQIAQQAKVVSIESQQKQAARVTVEIGERDLERVTRRKSEGQLTISESPTDPAGKKSREETPLSMKSQGGNEVQLDSLDGISPIPSAADFSNIRVAGIGDGLTGWAESQNSGPGVERYLSTADSSPVLVSQEAVSTFSIDVDTASYTNTRRFIEQGQLPPREAVRTEEFVNYFDYAYPVQRERPFTLSYELAPSPLTPGRALLKLGIKAKDALDERKPWNLVFLIDTSGSMSDENKLPLVKKALRVLVDKMRPEDRVAIVTYAGSSEVRLGSTSGAEKARIGGVIEGLFPGGGTHGSGGIQTAYSLAVANKAPGINRVVLVTDGDFNVGVTSHDDLIQIIEQQRQSGIALTTIGVGEGNINDALLEQLADKGDGNYFYLDSFREARRIFEDKITGTIETVAKDVKLQLEFNPNNVIQYKLIGYENRLLAKQDFQNDAVDAGEVGAGHTVTALYELVLAGSAGAGGLVDSSRYQQAPKPQALEMRGDLDNELGFLKIRYKAPDSTTSQLVEFPIAMTDLRKEIGETTADFRFAIAVAGFAQSLRGTLPAGVTLEQLIALAERGVGADVRGERRQAIDLMKSARALQGQAGHQVPVTPSFEPRYR